MTQLPYRIVHPSGQVLASAPTARGIMDALEAVGPRTRYHTIVDRQGGIITRRQLEQLCQAEERSR